MCIHMSPRRVPSTRPSGRRRRHGKPTANPRQALRPRRRLPWCPRRPPQDLRKAARRNKRRGN
eukprot:7853406-Pyramimonas_sp.AAC.1